MFDGLAGRWTTMIKLKLPRKTRQLGHDLNLVVMTRMTAFVKYAQDMYLISFHPRIPLITIISLCLFFLNLICTHFESRYSWLQNKTGIENFPNVNLVLFICQLIVYLRIPIKYFF
jgi:hypothetical protein